jgi:hypothetical protein
MEHCSLLLYGDLGIVKSPYDAVYSYLMLDIFSLMSTVEDHWDVMMSFYDELSWMKNRVQKNIIKSLEEIAMNRLEGRTLIESQEMTHRSHSIRNQTRS